MDTANSPKIPAGWDEEITTFQFDSNAIYIALFSTTGRLVYSNRAMKTLFNGEPSESLKNPTFQKLLLYKNNDPMVFEGILTIGDLYTFTSIRSKIYRKQNEILIMGEVDAKELLKQNEITLHLNTDINNLQRQLIKEKSIIEKTLKELQESMERVKVLSGLLPICANCKKIRDDKGYWQAVEGYIMDHTDAKFSHGVCPECAKKLYPEILKKLNNNT
jgi:hypothetical protein